MSRKELLWAEAISDGQGEAVSLTHMGIRLCQEILSL